MELGAAGGHGVGRRAFIVDANRQTHQCRISLCSDDPAGQHHDTGAEPINVCGPGARGYIINSAAERAGSGTAPRCIGCSGCRDRQKAGRAEACGIPATAYAGAGSANAPARSAGARSFE